MSDPLLLSYQSRATEVTRRYVEEKGLGDEVGAELLSALGLDEIPANHRVITSLAATRDNGG